LIGGAGADTFEFSKGAGRDVIADFEVAGAGHDKIHFFGFSGVSSFDDVLVKMEQVVNDVRIDLGHGDCLLIKNIKIGDFGDWSFI
jgi:hypothetical protein